MNAVLRSNSFLLFVLSLGVGSVLFMAYIATEGDLAVMALLLGASGVCFGVLALVLTGLQKLAERFLR